jgi:hypothetical protein
VATSRVVRLSSSSSHSRSTSESTNSRVQWWSIFQATVMVLSGVWQIRHLQAFFKSKKVV